ncbi:MAG: hypothetical protein ACOC9X_00445 [bacterium]
MTETTPSPQPTMSLIGAGSADPAARRIFSSWAPILNLGEAQLVAVDLPPDAPDETYRDLVTRLKEEAHAQGALVAAHGRELLHAAGRLFDDLTSEAGLCDRISCLYKYEGHLLGHAIEPEVSAQVMARLLGHGYWRRHRADLLCLGAGSAAIALLIHFATRAMIDDRPRQLLLVDRDLARLQHVERMLRRLSTAEMAVQLIHNTDAAANDRLLADLPARSLVVNATDAGRSPLGGGAPFPQHGVVWDLNYDGDLEFLQHARSQIAERDLQLADGWDYFLTRWATALGYIFSLTIDDAAYDRLAAAARPLR